MSTNHEVPLYRATGNAHLFYDPEVAELATLAVDLGATMAVTYLNATQAAAVVALVTTTGLYLGINSGSPGQTGSNEILGTGMVGYTSGGYTGVSDGTSTGRPKITWGSFSTDHQTSTNTQTFALLATFGSGINYFSIWTDTGASGHAGTYITGGATSGSINGSSVPSGANVTFTNGLTVTVTG